MVVAVVLAGAAFALRGGGVVRAVTSAGLATLSTAAAFSVIIPLLLRVRAPVAAGPGAGLCVAAVEQVGGGDRDRDGRRRASRRGADGF